MHPIKATPQNTTGDVLNGAPGSFMIPDDGRHIFCACPCGCSGHMRLRLYLDGTPKPENGKDGSGPAWAWDGNRESPTLSPSIRDIGTCFFHGHLQNGSWTFEGDSGISTR